MATIMQVGGNGVSKFFNVTIPKGRMKGDVNGDGFVSYKDYCLMSVKLTLKGVSDLDYYGDDVSVWCADYNGDGTWNVKDTVALRQYFLSNLVVASTPMADYYNNWTYVHVEGTVGYFYIDIPISGLTTISSVAVFVDGALDCDLENSRVVSSGVFRFCVTRPPIKELSATIVTFPSGGEVIINAEKLVPEKVFIVTATGSAGSYVCDKKYGEVLGALMDGCVCEIHIENNIKPIVIPCMGYVDGATACFSRVTNTGITNYILSGNDITNTLSETTAQLTFA